MNNQDDGWKMIFWMVLISVVITTILAWLTEPISIFGMEFSWSTQWSYAAAFYILLSFRFWDVIPADRIGVRTIFGKPTGTVSSGLPIVPPLIGDIKTFPTVAQQEEFPAQPEKIFRGDMNDPAGIPPGTKPPVRITFGISLTAANAEAVLGEYYRVTNPITGKEVVFQTDTPADSLSDSRVNAEVVVVVRWRVFDAVSFVKNIGTENEVNRQIEDEMFSILGKLYSLISVAQAQQNYDWMNIILFQSVERRIQATNGHSDAWGIDLEGAYVKPLIYNHTLNAKITSVAEASFAGEATVRAAKRAAEATVLAGEAAAAAAKALAKGTLAGRGQGIAAAAKSTGLDSATILGAETAQAVGKGDGTIIIGADGMSQLAGIAAAFAPKKPTQP